MRLSIIYFPDEPQAFPIDAQPEVRVSDGTDDVVQNTIRKLGIWVKNPTAGQVLLTLPAHGQCIHHHKHPAPIPVPAGFEGLVAKFVDSSRFNDAGYDVTLQYDAAGLRVAAIDLD